jgi:PAS domain S-box-containing protein
MKDLLKRLEISRKTERNARTEMERAQSVSHIGNWVWDITTNDLSWSDEIFRICGLRPQQFDATYEAFLDIVHPEDRDSVGQAVRDAMAGVREYDIVHRLIRPDGTIRFVSEKSEVTFDEAGKAIKMIGTVQDITERKLAEDLSLRFGRIMDESFNEIYIIDIVTFQFIQINKSARRNIQYTAKEMSIMTPADISLDLTPEQLEPLFKPLQEGVKDRVVITSQHVRKDGSRYPVEVLLQVSKHETPPKIVAIVQDITERQKAERAMQEAMQTLEARVRERTVDLERITRENELLLNTAGEGICGIDKEGLITFANPAAQKILGYVGEDCTGHSHHDTCHHKRVDGSHYPQHECLIEKTLQDGQAYRASDEVFWRKDGTSVPVEYVSNPIHEDGKVIGAVVTFKDITERKRADEKLQKSEEKFRKYFELPLVGIAITSLEKGWLEVNDKLCEFFGYLRDELTQMTWAELTYPDDLEADVAEFNKVIEGASDGYTMEKRFIHKNGEVIHAEISVRCVRKPGGQVDYFVALVQDINARKKAEQELIEAKDEAERANSAKSKFMSQMSHELRTPLNAILGFSQLIESNPAEPLTDTQKEGTDEILKAGRHLLDLINEILDLARIETGKISLSIEDINLSDMVEELLALSHPMAKQQKVNLYNHIAIEGSGYVRADRVRLKQVLLNLISNAIKYNKAGGDVKLNTIEGEDGMIEISVSDTGHGIEEERMKELFQPFNRMDYQYSEIEGTGIGLTIAKQLIECMDGSIRAESKPGEGSVFTVSIARGTGTLAPKDLFLEPVSIAPDLLREQKKYVILYIEDNPANLNLIRHVFRRRPDVDLLTAPDAKLGIELAQAHFPDLILMDINLPGMDGITAMKFLQNKPETQDIPVVAISANAMPREVKKGLAAGFCDYLTKPLDLVEFHQMLEEQLKGDMKHQ